MFYLSNNKKHLLVCIEKYFKQCLGRGHLHQNIRNKFNDLFDRNSGNYDMIFQDGYIDDHKNTGKLNMMNTNCFFLSQFTLL